MKMTNWEDAKKEIEKFWDTAERTERYNFFKSSSYLTEEKVDKLSKMDFKDIPDDVFWLIPAVIFCPICRQPLIADDSNVDWMLDEEYDYQSGFWIGTGEQKCTACSQVIVTSWAGRGGRTREARPDFDLWCDDYWAKAKGEKKEYGVSDDCSKLISGGLLLFGGLIAFFYLKNRI